MAYIKRCSAYVIVKDKGESGLPVEVRQNVETRSKDFPWSDDLPIAQKNCDLAFLEAYFDDSVSENNGREVKAGEVYRHFKEGKLVEVIDVAQHSECPNQKLVVYNCDNGKVFARPLEMFLSEVDHEKYPDVKQKYRFERVN